MGSGHYPDCYLVMPIHDGSTLAGYAATIAHQVDVGGAAPGSQLVQGVSEAFQEGLRILPVRVMREGKFVEDVLRLILGNVRLPDMMRGDLIAQRNANFLGGTQFLALYRHYGAKVFDRIVTEILDHTERDIGSGSWREKGGKSGWIRVGAR